MASLDKIKNLWGVHSTAVILATAALEERTRRAAQGNALGR